MSEDVPMYLQRGPLDLPAFGNIEPVRVLGYDGHFAAIADKYPITPGHSLIIPRREVQTFRQLYPDEQILLLRWIQWTQDHLLRTQAVKPEGFNMGINDGPAAGQTMPQLHFHIIPRRTGDVPDPRGGLRWIIPDKAKYW